MITSQDEIDKAIRESKCRYRRVMRIAYGFTGPFDDVPSLQDDLMLKQSQEQAYPLIDARKRTT